MHSLEALNKVKMDLRHQFSFGGILMNDSKYALEVLNEEGRNLICFDRVIIDGMIEKDIIKLATAELMLKEEPRLVIN